MKEIPYWILAEIHCLIADRANKHNQLFGFVPILIYSEKAEKISQQDVDELMTKIMIGLGCSESQTRDKCCGRPCLESKSK